MLKAIKYSATGEEIGKVDLPEALFAAEAKNPEATIYEVIKCYLRNQRQGTAAVKFRGDVKGSGRKLYRQKGTGNARVGNSRTNIRVGGGNAFGPIPKNWNKPIPKKKRRLALKLALTERAKSNQVIVIESLDFDKPNTKGAMELLTKISPDKVRKLILVDGSDKNIVKSFSNLEYVEMNRADSTFAYEILKCKNLILTEAALSKILEVFNK